ncbi:MAG TPA: CBS domain-containing protein, partial [bacterium (Candidatus Stahlbacteria)]|nr:CBS domain-containing protein [Candidatus Stahlbacteria bacterium]
RFEQFRNILLKCSTCHTFPMILVVDDNGRLIGKVSISDLINVFRIHEPDILKTIPFLREDEVNIFDFDLPPELGFLLLVEDIMEADCLTITDDKTIEEAYREMNLNKLNQIPVVDQEGKLVGVIGVFDIIQVIFKDLGII